MVTFDHIQDERKNNLRKNVAGILVPWSKTVRLNSATLAARKHNSFATLLHVININKTGNARMNARIRRVRATIVALEK